ncbi:MAG: ATP-binding protein [bacterium]|nr:ATP-binding protein [bacterium]
MEIFAISGLINGIASLSFALFIIYKNWRDKINRVFFLLMTGMVIWSLGYWQWLLSTSYETASFWIKVFSIGSTLIPAFYFHWIILILKKETEKRILKLVYGLTFLIIILSLIFPDLFIKNIVPKLSFPFWPEPGILYHFYLASVYGLLVSYALTLLIKTYKKSSLEIKGRAFYVILGSIFGFGGGLTNFFLWYNIPVPPYGNFLVAAFPVFFGYAMLKHNLFNSKVVATELLTFSIWVFLLIRTTTSSTLQDFVINGGIFILTAFAGVLLIRSVIKEVEQREKLEKMSIQLSIANDELKRVDEAKSEFLSIVSHQLRTPLTAIKGYISMMIEGSYGKLQEIQSATLEKVFQSAERLIVLVNDLLNLNRIEDGRIIYTFGPVDIAQMIDDTVFDLKAMAENKGLKLAWIKPHGLPRAWADADKIRQVVINFIDNSIKYTAKGNVNVSLRLENNYLVYKVQDTGVGMTPEGKSRLFRKFERGEGGRLMYTEGTGLGLYVAKLMTEAHKGIIKGESEGKDKGSTFSITIPTEEYARKNNINQKTD